MDLLHHVKKKRPVQRRHHGHTASTNVESASGPEKRGRDYLLKPVNHDEFRHSVALCNGTAQAPSMKISS
jgi:hypothetical protein